MTASATDVDWKEVDEALPDPLLDIIGAYVSHQPDYWTQVEAYHTPPLALLHMYLSTFCLPYTCTEVNGARWYTHPVSPVLAIIHRQMTDLDEYTSAAQQFYRVSGLWEQRFGRLVARMSAILDRV